MNYQIVLLLVPFALSAISYLLLIHWVKMRREASFLTTVGVALGGVVMVVWRASQSYSGSPEAVLILACSLLLIVFTVPFGLKLYRAWAGIQATPEERASGAIGVRVWLAPGNLIIAALIAGCAATAFDWPFLGVLALLVGCLLIQPLIINAGAASSTPAGEPTLSAERKKVLELLEAGKITAAESAELLNALSSTSRSAALPVSTRQQRMALIGAALVLVGFFLPWFSVSPAKELGRLAEMLGRPAQHVERMSEDVSGYPGFSTAAIHVTGGDVQNGLGWVVLVLGLGSAVLPYVATTMAGETQRMIAFLGLGAGSIVLMWLISQNLRIVNVGAILTLAGYGLELAGWRNPRPQSTPSAVVPQRA